MEATPVSRDEVTVGDMPNFSHLTNESPPEAFEPYARYLSQHFAPDGVGPVIPRRAHIDQAAREGWGTSSFRVKKALGSIDRLQELAGFIARTTTQSWTRDDYIANGIWMSHMLGSADEPRMPEYKDLLAFIRLRLAPTEEDLLGEFGTVTKFQDALGFVTPATLERWTHDDWITNGQWLSHMLGSAEEPVMPISTDIATASKAHLCPTVDSIYKEFGDLPAYQTALGFTPRRLPSPLAYEQWDRDEYIRNGQWLAAAMGTPEHPEMPMVPDLIEGSKLGLCPPIGSIQRTFDESLRNYQDALGFVTATTLQRWTEQEWIDNGVWLSHMLGSAEEPVMPTGQLLEAGSAANISPNRAMVLAKFGSVAAYQEALGFEPQLRRRWPLRQWLQHILTVAETHTSLDQLRPSDFDCVEGPNRKAIAQKFGHWPTVYKRLDLPDYDNFTPDQILAFGVRMAAARGHIPFLTEIHHLRSKHRGPSPKRCEPYDEFYATVREALPHYLALAGQLAEKPGIGPDLAAHLLKDYRVGEEYASERLALADALGPFAYALGDDTNRLEYLWQLFGATRALSLRWEKEHFIRNFGAVVCRPRDLPPEAHLHNLTLLHRAKLAPMPEDIQDVFGSDEALIAATLAAL